MSTETIHPLEQLDLLDIAPVSTKWQKHARQHIDQLTKPPGSLGRVEELAERIVSIQQTEAPSLDGKAVYVFAADHGVVEEGVSAYPSDVTSQMVANFLHGGAAINAFCRAAGADVVVVDIGVAAELPPHRQMVAAKIRHGSRNLRREAAMTQEETMRALRVGYDLAAQAKQDARGALAIGEMGIGNTTPASAVAAALLNCPAAEVTGPGTGLSNDKLLHKQQVIDQALLHHRSELHSPFDILRCLGGYEIAGMAGMVLGAAAHRLPIVIDGVISTSAVALAYAVCPTVRDYLFAGHVGSEPAHRRLLDYIGLRPILDLELRLGEGTGAALAFPILQAAVQMYRDMATFSSAGVSGSLQ